MGESAVSRSVTRYTWAMSIEGALSPRPQTIKQLAERLYGDHPTRAQIERVRYAARRLARQGDASLGWRLVDHHRHLTVKMSIRMLVGEDPYTWCDACSRLFKAKRRDARYCSPKCRQRGHRRTKAMIADAKAGRVAPFYYRGKLYGPEPGIASPTRELSEPERIEHEGPLTDREWQLVGEGKLYVPEART